MARGSAVHHPAPSSAPPRQRHFWRYLHRLAALAVSLSGLVVLLNLFVDPLWYWHGNQITGRNFPLNERLSRMNLLLQEPEAYDCLVFGSSRVGLLDHTRVAGYRCFNMTFSAGSVVEFLDYARYLADLGLRPRLVIVGVDDYNYLPGLLQPPETPDFVRHNEPPPGILTNYLSIDAARLSLRTLMQASDESRYYDSRMIGRVLETAPRFEPTKRLHTARSLDDLDPGRAALYRRLRRTFPEAAFWGYVPPISAWNVAEERYRAGVLDRYLDATAATARAFDRFYDFSAPSRLTRRTDNSYDGNHYFPWVNAIIAERLQAGSDASPADGFGLPVHALTRAQYGAAFRAHLRRFLVEQPAATGPDSPG
ncbi:MAG: hypothetical protein ACM35H_04355 [Bacteroidota bacterium]|nr:hypothetical protein [Kiloniellaceae bacterium]